MVSLFDNMMSPGQKQNSSKYSGKSASGQKQQSSKGHFSGEAGGSDSSGKKNSWYQSQSSGSTPSSQSYEFGKSGKSHFEEEFSDSLTTQPSQMGVQSYTKAGVTFEKLSETQAKINYNGLLAKSGAQQVYGVFGFGSNQNWENVSTIPLNKSADGGFSSIIPVEQGKNINFAFKDPAENWDNNSGMNYTFVN